MGGKVAAKEGEENFFKKFKNLLRGGTRVIGGLGGAKQARGERPFKKKEKRGEAF